MPVCLCNKTPVELQETRGPHPPCHTKGVEMDISGLKNLAELAELLIFIFLSKVLKSLSAAPPVWTPVTQLRGITQSQVQL